MAEFCVSKDNTECTSISNNNKKRKKEKRKRKHQAKKLQLKLESTIPKNNKNEHNKEADNGEPDSSFHR